MKKKRNKTLIIIAIIFWVSMLFTATELKAQTLIITDIAVIQSNNNIIVTYNLKGSTADSFKIELFYNLNNSNQWYGPLQNITGDCGTGITAGNGKKITWNVLAEKNELNADIVFEIRATKEGNNNFVLIQGGTFQMGDGTTHSVTLSTFYMSKYEVTQAQWKAVMGSNPAKDYGVGDNFPVYYVSWYDCIEFCNKLSLSEGRTPCYTIDKTRQDPNNANSSDNVKWIVTCNYSANGYRLPTEAEWEYACRAGTTTSYYWGNSADEAIMKQYAWYEKNADDGYWTNPHATKEGTQPVGQKTPNAWGMYDMSGNVWEWCIDWYGTYPSGSQTNPKGAETGSYRVLRGGSWNNSAYNCRVANRNNSNADSRNGDYGFRLVRSY